MLEVLWKVVESIIYTKIKTVVMLHKVMHAFCANRCTGIAIMELKMAQDIASIDQYPLLMEFL